MSRPDEAVLPGLFRLRSEIGRLFDRFLGWERGFGAWAPSIDVSESDREVVVRAEIPGLSPDDLDLSVSGNYLVLSGRKQEEQREEKGAVLRSERRYGSFRRTLPLPPGADPDQAVAEYDKGVLVVRFKKSETAKPRKIVVTKPSSA